MEAAIGAIAEKRNAPQARLAPGRQQRHRGGSGLSGSQAARTHKVPPRTTEVTMAPNRHVRPAWVLSSLPTTHEDRLNQDLLAFVETSA